MKRKYDEVRIIGYYNLDGDYLVWEHNKHHNKTFKNVRVEITKKVRKIMDINFAVDVIRIEGYEHIECELVKKEVLGKTLILGICEDWG